MDLTARFTKKRISLNKSYCDDPDEVAVAEGGGSFAEYTMVSLHGPQIFLHKTCEMIIDELEVIPQFWTSSALLSERVDGTVNSRRSS